MTFRLYDFENRAVALLTTAAGQQRASVWTGTAAAMHWREAPGLVAKAYFHGNPLTLAEFATDFPNASLPAFAGDELVAASLPPIAAPNAAPTCEAILTSPDLAPEPTEMGNLHFTNSVLRERIVEHLFVGEALRLLWRRGITDVEVMRSEFDAGGYDLVMSRGKVVRHIQFKTMTVGGKATGVSIGLKLMEKPSGCVIWTLVTPGLDLQSYLWFGGAPGESMPDIAGMKTTKNNRANAQGVKAERPLHRVVPRSAFAKLQSLDEVLEKLFGPLS